MAASIPTLLKGYAIFAFLMGSASTVLGNNMMGDSTLFKPKSTSSALTDSQIRYLGSHFAATGAIVWWASNNLLERKVPLAICGAGLVAGGFGRLRAGLKHGFGPNTKAAMNVEIFVPTLFYIFGKVVGEW